MKHLRDRPVTTLSQQGSARRAVRYPMPASRASAFNILKFADIGIPSRDRGYPIMSFTCLSFCRHAHPSRHLAVEKTTLRLLNWNCMARHDAVRDSTPWMQIGLKVQLQNAHHFLFGLRTAGHSVSRIHIQL